MATAALDPDAEALAALVAAAGADAVITDPDERRFFSQDAGGEGALPLAVLRPATVEALQAGVAAATAHGLAVHPRGGGMSYTDAFLPQTARAIVVDCTALDRVVAIDPAGLWVTVEAGCTWAALDAALAPYALRAPFWGPFSGHTATVGGSVSQGTATFGSGRAGISGDQLLGLDVVLADGRLLSTGSGGQAGHTPFFRNYGPDLTGLFAQDAGALGVKARVTLPLEPRPAEVGGVSFLFADFRALTAAMQAVAREGLASEAFAMDPVVTRQFAGEARTLAEDITARLAIGRAERAPLRRLAAMARTVLGGRGFLDREGYHCHFVSEAPDRSRLNAQIARIRRLCRAGAELSPTVPAMVRAQPFAPLSVLSPKGERMIPLHGIVPYPAAAGLDAAVAALVAARRAELDAAGVVVATSFFGIGRNAFLYEPVIYWPDDRTLYHERRTPDGTPRHPANPAARTLVAELKAALIEAFWAAGAVHLQIGRAYPWLRERNAPFLDLVRAIKREVDPDNRMNPGALGL